MILPMIDAVITVLTASMVQAQAMSSCMESRSYRLTYNAVLW